MRKLICTQCEMTWYTSSACEIPKCDNCGGSLKDADSEVVYGEHHEGRAQ